jgi:hypothetical protein
MDDAVYMSTTEISNSSFSPQLKAIQNLPAQRLDEAQSGAL